MTMEHKTWITMDKSTWGDGPWMAEPDKEQFADETTGLPCLIKRNQAGSLCGYVGVSEGHPWFGRGYDDVRVTGDECPEVHGGLTFADFCQEGDEADTICHIPDTGDFACVHEWSRWLEDRDGQGIHGGDHRRRGVGQPSCNDQSQDEFGTAVNITETGPASVEHVPGINRMARGDMGSRVGGRDLPSPAPTSPDSLRLAREGHDSGGDSAGSAAVFEDQGAAGGTWNSRSRDGDSVPEAGRSRDGETSRLPRRNAETERDSVARYCPDCQRMVSPGRTYWLGFDCAHAFDLSPAMRAWERAFDIPSMENLRTELGMGEVYKTIAYVKAECASLAEQAQASRVTQTAVEGIDAMTAAEESGP